MKAKNLFGMCAALAVCAGMAATANAGPTPGSKGLVAVKAEATRVDPVKVRGVRYQNGKVYPTTPWIAYNPQGGAADATEYAFDAFESTTGGPGGAPTGNRYLLQWPGGSFNYNNPVYVNDMTLASGNNGAQSQFGEILFYLQVNEQTFSYLLFTAEDYSGDPSIECGDPAFENGYDGIELGFEQIAKGFYYTNVDLTGPGLFWQLPNDGVGAYMGILCKGLDGNGAPIPTAAQPGLWGTGEDELPPDGRNGTQEIAQVSDDSTPPTCAADLATNKPNYITEAACECYDYTFAGLPVGVPNPLCASVGFSGGEGTSCYADCDGSGELDIDDFICFQTNFGFGDPAADCDNSGELDIDDFICYQTAYGIGCGG
jgi:hypothetical protein